MAGQLTPDEAKFYRGVFVTLDWMNNKQIPANPQLKLLLSSSRLPVATLGQLWSLSFALATNNKRDWLTDRDLCIVLRLISVAQAGQPLSYEAIKAPNLPLPKIDINMLREAHKKAIADGLVPAPTAATPTPAATQPTSPAPAQPASPAAQASASPAAAQASASPAPAQATPAAQPSPAAAQPTPAQATPAAGAAAASGTIDWTMSEKQKQDYSRSFEQLDPNKTGMLSAVDAVGFLRKSKLPENILREIWKLSDLGRDGALDLTEFCIAMHLVLKARSNIPIPPTLPPVLLPAKYAADAEAKANALKEQQAKEAQAKEQQEKEAQAKEEQLKKEEELKQQQAKEAELKEQQQKEQEAKAKQELEQQKEQQAAADKPADKPAESKTEGEEPKSEPPKSKFATRPMTAPDSHAEPAPAPSSGRSREVKPAAERQRSPAARTAVSPSPRSAPPAPTDNSSTGLAPAPVAPLPGKKQDFSVASRISSSPLPIKNPDAGGDAERAKKAVAVRAWVEAVLHEKIPVSISLGDALKSGVRLCKMLNTIEPNSVLDISNNQFMRRENILAFLDALRKKGFKPAHLFLVDELFEMQNLDAVYDTMIHLDAYAGNRKFEGVRLNYKAPANGATK